uniref:rhomboid family intramembrane serine protease n=1 Tax=Siminovitchia fortis TaxID=254758 RepID=UPI0011A4A399
GGMFGLLGMYLGMSFLKKEGMGEEGKEVILGIGALSVMMRFLQGNVNMRGDILGMMGGFIMGGILIKVGAMGFV